VAEAPIDASTTVVNIATIVALAQRATTREWDTNCMIVSTKSYSARPMM
jgi:hypothetical protein